MRVGGIGSVSGLEFGIVHTVDYNVILKRTFLELEDEGPGGVEEREPVPDLALVQEREDVRGVLLHGPSGLGTWEFKSLDNGMRTGMRTEARALLEGFGFRV